MNRPPVCFECGNDLEAQGDHWKCQVCGCVWHPNEHAVPPVPGSDEE